MQLDAGKLQLDATSKNSWGFKSMLVAFALITIIKIFYS